MSAGLCCVVRRKPGWPLFRTYVRGGNAEETEILRKHFANRSDNQEWIVREYDEPLFPDCDQAEWRLESEPPIKDQAP